jgi:hypothetical protein
MLPVAIRQWVLTDNIYYLIFTIKLQSNKNIFNTSLQDLTNLYKQQKDLKINLSRVSGVETLFKMAIW